MNEALKQLFEMLLSRTDAKLVRWHEVDENMYRTEVGFGLVRIAREDLRIRSDDDDDDVLAEAFRVTIINEDGRIAEECKVRPVDANYTTVRNLFSAARRSALGTEDLLRKMLLALGSNK